MTAVVVIFYSLDVWMARIFFSPESSGAYAIASLLGKILFWGTIPISKAMMPLSSDSTNDKTGHVINNSIFLIATAIIITTALFYLFPYDIIKIFTGRDVNVAGDILFYEGLSFGIIALANLLLLYNLSVNRFKKYWIMLVPLLIEIIIMSLFADSVSQFAIAFLVSSVIFFAFSIVFAYINRGRKIA